MSYRPTLLRRYVIIRVIRSIRNMAIDWRVPRTQKCSERGTVPFSLCASRFY